MASAIYPTRNYQQKIIVRQFEEASTKEVTFVPTPFDLQAPVRKVKRALQWQRQVTEFISGFVSGAVSIR